MASLDKTLRYPCLLCIPTLMKRYPATFSWVDDILSIPPSTKTLVPDRYLNSSIKITDHRAVNSSAMSMFRLLDSIPLANLPNFSIQRPTKNISTTKIFTLKEWLIANNKKEIQCLNLWKKPQIPTRPFHIQ